MEAVEYTKECDLVMVHVVEGDRPGLFSVFIEPVTQVYETFSGSQTERRQSIRAHISDALVVLVGDALKEVYMVWPPQYWALVTEIEPLALSGQLWTEEATRMDRVSILAQALCEALDKKFTSICNRSE